MSEQILRITKLQNNLVVRTWDGTELLRTPDTTVKQLKELINKKLDNKHFVMLTPQNDKLLGWKTLIGVQIDKHNRKQTAVQSGGPNAKRRRCIIAQNWAITSFALQVIRGYVNLNQLGKSSKGYNRVICEFKLWDKSFIMRPGQKVPRDTEVLYVRGTARIGRLPALLIVKRRVEYASGMRKYFEGAKGQQAMRRIEYPDGRKFFYDGAKGHEALRRMELPNGQKSYFEGVAGHEALRRIELQ
jgi:hypothetical protein